MPEALRSGPRKSASQALSSAVIEACREAEGREELCIEGMSVISPDSISTRLIMKGLASAPSPR